MQAIHTNVMAILLLFNLKIRLFKKLIAGICKTFYMPVCCGTVLLTPHFFVFSNPSCLCIGLLYFF